MSHSRPELAKALILGSPFDYEKQAILYIPDDIRNRSAKGTDHTAAVLDELTELIEAPG